jgi:signal transduction histidine kinase
VIAPVSTDAFARLSQDPDRQRALRSAGLTSVVGVPLLAHATLLGVVTLIACRESRRTISIRVAEALAERAALSIANARLLRETQRALRVRDDVLAIVSHDLRNPVATIGLLADLLRQTDPGSRTRLAALAEDIQRSVDDMHLLIDDLLDFARIHSATFAVEVHPHQLDAVVTPVVDRLRLLAGARHQTIDVDIPGDLPAVDVDVRRIRQVVANLVGNAIKFTGDGGAIRVEARQHDGIVRVSVTDTGIGVPPEYLSRIFDPAATGAAAGQRPRAVDRQGHRRGARRRHLGREHAGARQHLLFHAARRRCGFAGVQRRRPAPARCRLTAPLPIRHRRRRRALAL